MIPTSIDGTDITGATIDGTDVQEITVDGQTVFTAGPTNDIANFNSGSLDSAFTGDRGNYSVVSSPTIEGSHSLTDSASGGETIYASNGLPDLPGPGDTFSTYIRGDGGSNFQRVLFGGPDGDNCYGAAAGSFGSSPRIEKIVSGSATGLASGSSSTNGDWFDLEVEFGSGGNITVRLFSVNQSTGSRISQIDSVTTTDTTFSTAGLGFQNGSSSRTHRYDNVRLF